MLDGAPPWRAELNRRWGGRADWAAFLTWEIDFRAEQWNRDSLPAGRFPKPIRPRGNQGRERILVEFTPGIRAFAPVVETLDDEFRIVEWEQPGAGLVRGCVARMDVQTEAGEFIWQWDRTFELVEEEQQAATGQEAEVFAGFVVSESGAYFVQLPQDNEFGFSLFDADQSWPGGIGAARKWTAVARESVPPEVEEELGWILDEFQPVI